MPIVDLTWVHADLEPPDDDLARRLADALGAALAAPPGTLWLRLHPLPQRQYAENAMRLAADELPAFLTLLLSRPPEGPARAAQVLALGGAVAAATGRDAARVHVEYAAPGAGRIAFGGRLVP